MKMWTEEKKLWTSFVNSMRCPDLEDLKKIVNREYKAREKRRKEADDQSNLQCV